MLCSLDADEITSDTKKSEEFIVLHKKKKYLLILLSKLQSHLSHLAGYSKGNLGKAYINSFHVTN
jgi:hypothetical protein